jgi:hypothetical protein
MQAVDIYVIQLLFTTIQDYHVLVLIEMTFPLIKDIHGISSDRLF